MTGSAGTPTPTSSPTTCSAPDSCTEAPAAARWVETKTVADTQGARSPMSVPPLLSAAAHSTQPQPLIFPPEPPFSFKWCIYPLCITTKMMKLCCKRLLIKAPPPQTCLLFRLVKSDFNKVFRDDHLHPVIELISVNIVVFIWTQQGCWDHLEQRLFIPWHIPWGNNDCFIAICLMSQFVEARISLHCAYISFCIH